jgi:hypothetical protein
MKPCSQFLKHEFFSRDKVWHLGVILAPRGELRSLEVNIHSFAPTYGAPRVNTLYFLEKEGETGSSSLGTNFSPGGQL